MSRGPKASDTPVVLFAYRRPELTRAAIQRIASTWTGPLFVSIDGPRALASEDEQTWRSQTVRGAELEASNFSNVNVKVWNTNQGLTDHARRIFQQVMELHESVIAVEEDIAVSREGMSWLAAVSLAPQPTLATAMTRFEHTALPTGETVRRTAFPSQWSTAFNRSVFVEFDRVWRDKRINQKVVDEVIATVIPNRVLAWASRDYWYSLFRDAALNDSHGDAIFQYASWSLGCLTLVPDRTEVTDLGPTDFRGLHQRAVRDDRIATHRPVPVANDKQSWICASCEMMSQRRLGINILMPVRRRLRVRSRIAQRGRGTPSLADPSPESDSG
jgi:hypothetical protein